MLPNGPEATVSSPRASPRAACRAGGAWGSASPGRLSVDNTASPEGVMTMISEITTAGAAARNRVPDDGLFDAVPLPSRVPSAALSLLRTARHGLAEAEVEGDPGTRYICAHLAALRAAAAIVAARGEPGSGARRRRPRAVWEALPQGEA